MAVNYRRLANGTKWAPIDEVLAGDEDILSGRAKVIRDDQGNVIDIDRPMNPITKAMAFAVPGMFAYGQLAPLLAGSGGGAAASAAGPGGLYEAVPPAIASQGVSASVPLGGMTAGGAAGAAGAAGAGAGAAGSLLGRAGQSLLQGLTSREGISSLASLLPLLMARGNGGAPNLGNLSQSMPQLNRLLDMSTARAERTDPLHQMVTRLATSRMPVNSR